MRPIRTQTKHFGGVLFGHAVVLWNPSDGNDAGEFMAFALLTVYDDGRVARWATDPLAFRGATLSSEGRDS